MRAGKDKPAMRLVETSRAAACRKLERKEYLLARIKSVVDAHENVAFSPLIKCLRPLFRVGTCSAAVMVFLVMTSGVVL